MHMGYTNSDFVICINDVKEAIANLKLGKSDGEEGLVSDHFINGTMQLQVLITCLFNCMLVHGVCPDTMSCGTMIPIPKDKRKSLDCSDNYRAITLGSIVSKILDSVIMLKEKSALSTSDLQFGFKKKSSTSHCTLAMLETISYYNFQKSDVYVALLDASKAFDRVKYCKLFRLLQKRKISPLVLRLLINMYTNQTLQIRWGAQNSSKFSVSNGVKQGGVLSPILFTVYINELLLKLEEEGIGCRVGNYYAGCLAYADDLTLLAPSKKGLQLMIQTCERFAKDFDIMFNGT